LICFWGGLVDLGVYLYFHFTGFVVVVGGGGDCVFPKYRPFLLLPPATTKATKLPNIPVADIPQSKISQTDKTWAHRGKPWCQY
jgi:hypothetical protein